MAITDSQDYSLAVFFSEDENDDVLRQEILELALEYQLLPYGNGENSYLFTNANKEPLRRFQEQLMSQNFNCEYVFKSPKPL